MLAAQPYQKLGGGIQTVMELWIGWFIIRRRRRMVWYGVKQKCAARRGEEWYYKSSSGVETRRRRRFWEVQVPTSSPWRKTIGNGKEGFGWGARALRARRRRISRWAAGICADMLGCVSWSSRARAPAPSALAASGVRLPLLVLCFLKILQKFSYSPSHRIFRRMYEVLNIDENKN